uniref:Uncharacterized protein n=1 Tax=Timema genevievae TaxID=629358 RepID=A0A7R9JY44_TIMGE|nr:unnamed protein product [Timema genevievae]
MKLAEKELGYRDTEYPQSQTMTEQAGTEVNEDLDNLEMESDTKLPTLNDELPSIKEDLENLEMERNEATDTKFLALKDEFTPLKEDKYLKGGFCKEHESVDNKCKEIKCSKTPLNSGFCKKHGETYPKCKVINCSKAALKGGHCKEHREYRKDVAVRNMGATRFGGRVV